MNIKPLAMLALACVCVVFVGFPTSAETPGGAAAAPSKYEPKVPAKITTPESVETRIGTLHFMNGTPDAATAKLVYDQLDFGRGIDAFLTGMSATSVYALSGASRKRASSLTRASASASTCWMPARCS
jgi:hypothetical protein